MPVQHVHHKKHGRQIGQQQASKPGSCKYTALGINSHRNHPSDSTGIKFEGNWYTMWLWEFKTLYNHFQGKLENQQNLIQDILWHLILMFITGEHSFNQDLHNVHSC